MTVLFKAGTKLKCIKPYIAFGVDEKLTLDKWYTIAYDVNIGDCVFGVYHNDGGIGGFASYYFDYWNPNGKGELYD